MVTIDPFQPSDLPDIVKYVEAIQEHERIAVPVLKPGREIGTDYAQFLIHAAAERNGCILMARAGTVAVGFGSAWVEQDDDPLLQEDARTHAYVSDVFVEDAWRRQGIGLRLLGALELEMRSRGCRLIRICSKAANRYALACYEKAGYLPYEIMFAKRLDV
jgi:ribosomal protein S18 acetylase RimI-like enzyme